jgi:hypothetical protein
MRILIIAPQHPGLPDIAKQAATAYNAYPGSVLLAGHVVEQEIAAAAAGGGFDLVWLATHAQGDEIQLSDATLAASSLAPAIAASGAYAVFLNTCNSTLVPLAILAATRASVIANLGDVDNGAAMRTGAKFAGRLAKLEDLWRAYQRSQPADNANYIFMQNEFPPAGKSKSFRKPGGQPGNTNALVHGLFACNFIRPDDDELAGAMAAKIGEDIGILRVFTRRTLELAQGITDVSTYLRVLDGLGKAAGRIARMELTNHMLSTPPPGSETAKAIEEALSQIA